MEATMETAKRQERVFGVPTLVELCGEALLALGPHKLGTRAPLPALNERQNRPR